MSNSIRKQIDSLGEPKKLIYKPKNESEVQKLIEVENNQHLDITVF